MSDFNVILKGIQKCALFNAFSEEEKEQLAAIGSIENFKKDDFLFSFEDKGDAFFIVLSGSLKAFLRNSQKKKYKAGQLFGEVSIFEGGYRNGRIKASENSALIRFEKRDIYDTDIFDNSLKLKITLALIKNIVEYFYEIPTNITELIKRGESEILEFKESIHKKSIEKILETIVAMCNHKGGTILIGVRDNGSVSGCTFEIDDLMKDFESLAHERVGNALLSMAHIFFDSLDNNRILRIECEPADNCIFWNQDNKDVLFVRANAINRKLETMQEVADYLQKRVKNNKY